MHVIQGRNAHSILPGALLRLSLQGERRDSRNGPVLKFPTPTTICYEKPTERVVFWADRDCNPFFHLMESLWMLAGRNDVGFLTQFVKRMGTFSDDGATFHGAYGYRWRNHFAKDQLNVVVEALRKNPDDRRCVVQMWDSNTDLGEEGRDFPCNTQAVFAINNDKLDMTVFNRSNDLVWGALGANAVHFSYLQEYMATRIGVPVGRYWQVSNNMHLYLEQHKELMQVLTPGVGEFFPNALPNGDPYERNEVAPFPLMSVDPEQWERELQMFMLHPWGQHPYSDPFFAHVARPMFAAHHVYQNNPRPERFEMTLLALEHVEADDWRRAAVEWVLRRKANWERVKDDGPKY